MALLNDIRKMQSEGKTEQEIISGLRQQGVSAKEIIDALSQSKIREAVSGQEGEAPSPYAQNPQSSQEQALMPSQNQEYQNSEMQASQQPSGESVQPYPQQSAEQPVQYQQAYQYQEQYPQQYQQQYSQQGTTSADTITEISEQVVAEKLSPLRKDVEKVFDFKTTAESKLEYLDDRLKRIEKIIDRLNLSIMQKVGDYMTNIDDIKKEIVETQKSFKALNPAFEVKDKSERQERAESKPKKLPQTQEEYKQEE